MDGLEWKTLLKMDDLGVPLFLETPKCLMVWPFKMPAPKTGGSSGTFSGGMAWLYLGFIAVYQIFWESRKAKTHCQFKFVHSGSRKLPKETTWQKSILIIYVLIIWMIIYTYIRIDCLCPAWLWKKVELSQNKFAKTYAKNIIAWHGKFGTTFSKFHNSSILYAKFHTWFPPLENASIHVLISILGNCPMIFYSILLTSQRLRVKYTSSCLANRIPSIKKHDKNPLKQLHPKNLNLTKPSKKNFKNLFPTSKSLFWHCFGFRKNVIFPNPWHRTPLHHTCRATASLALCWRDFELNRRHKPPPVAPKRRSLVGHGRWCKFCGMKRFKSLKFVPFFLSAHVHSWIHAFRFFFFFGLFVCVFLFFISLFHVISCHCILSHAIVVVCPWFYDLIIQFSFMLSHFFSLHFIN